MVGTRSRRRDFPYLHSKTSRFSQIFSELPYLASQEISIFSEFLRSSIYISMFCTYKYFLIIFLASLYNRGGGQSMSLLTSGSQEGDVASGYECTHICMRLLSFISNGHQCPADQIDTSFVLSCCESRCIK